MISGRLVRDANREKLMMPYYSNLFAERREVKALTAGTVHIFVRIVPVTTV